LVHADRLLIYTKLKGSNFYEVAAFFLLAVL